MPDREETTLLQSGFDMNPTVNHHKPHAEGHHVNTCLIHEPETTSVYVDSMQFE